MNSFSNAGRTVGAALSIALIGCIPQVQSDDPGLCLLEDIRLVDLECPLKAEPLRGFDGGNC